MNEEDVEFILICLRDVFCVQL